MGEVSVKLVRVPIDTNCVDCKRSLPFGAWAYYLAEDEKAICPECAVKRGWSSKERANTLIKEMEIREDVKALRKQRKVETDCLFLLREKIDLHRLGERDLELERQIAKMAEHIDSYLVKAATPEEKQALQAVLRVIRESQDLQKEIREQIQSRLFLLERDEAKRKKKGLLPSVPVEEE